MGKFINPFTDVGFKKIFGQEVSKDLLIDFLNDLLVGERSIKDITFLDKELLPEYMGDRGVIYDIYCTTEAGEHIIVEMQNRQQTNFKERALFYLSHTITRQGEKGARWEFDLKAVYGVFFMNFRLEDTPHKLRTDIVLSDRDTHEVFSDKLRFIFIELPSFNKEEEECETDFERWIYILKNMETLNRLPFKARKAVFEKLEKIVDIASLSKEERMKYDESIKVYRDNLATISFAENKGLKRGREEGLKEGIEKGLKEGRKEGILSVAGKSTLMRGLLGLIQPQSGTIEHAPALKHGAIGYLPQQTRAQRDFPATVLEVVLSGCLNRQGLHFFYTPAQRSEAMMNLGKLGILELKDACYRDLSGGQQQRVLLARALCAASQLLILDEPITGLDPAAAQDLYKTLAYLNQKEGMAIVMVTHDLKAALKSARTVLHIGRKGLFTGTASDYLASPQGRRFREELES